MGGAGAGAEAAHLAGQRSVPVVAVLSVESCRIVVLSMPSSAVPIATVAVVGHQGGLRSV